MRETAGCIEESGEPGLEEVPRHACDVVVQYRYLTHAQTDEQAISRHETLLTDLAAPA